MDREALRKNLLSADSFERFTREEQKQSVEGVLGTILDAIDAEGREPDDWEQKTVPWVATNLSSGNYLAALDGLRLVLASPAKRSAEFVNGPPKTMEMLRHHLSFAIRSPVRMR